MKKKKIKGGFNMKKTMHILSLLLLGILFITFPFQSVDAAESNGFEYEELGDGTAVINQYTGKAEHVTIPEKWNGQDVVAIDQSAFSHNNTIKSIEIPGSVKTINEFAFKQCEALEEITFSEGLDSIGRYAFQDCTSLKSLKIPASLKRIGKSAFDGCSSLSNITVKNGNNYVHSKNNVLLSANEDVLYFYPAGLRQSIYVIPDSVTKISTNITSAVFKENATLKKIFIHDNVTTIPEDIFEFGVIICCNENSMAERYAIECGLTSSTTDKYVPVESVVLSQKNLVLNTKDSVKLSATVAPSTASEQMIRWSSNNPAVAEVDIYGNVTPKANGSASIYAHCDGKSDYCSVTVELKTATPDPKPTPGGDDNQNGGSDNQKPENNGNQNSGNTTPTPDYKVSFKSQTYKVYATGKVKAGLTSNMAGDGFKTVKSSNTAVAKVDNNGTITGVKKGTAVITATTKSGKTITAKVSVITPAVKLNASNLPLQLKKSTTALKVKSKLATDSIVQWKSTNPKVAAVDKKTGKITAKKKGTTYVSVTMKSGAVAKCKISVQVKAVETTKLTVNAKAKTLKLKGGSKTFQIKVTKAPITSLQKVTYKSSKKSVATVSGTGKITAKKAGNTTITVKAGKKTAKIKITVKKK